jgi:hypothetical protein
MKQLDRALRFLFWSVAAVTLAACATTPPGGITADPNISLPITFNKVWYRTAKVRMLGLAYEASGVLTVREDSIEFSHKDGTVRIPGGNIEKVTWGKLWPDIMNDWVIIHFAGSEQGAVAAFNTLSYGGIENQLYSAILRVAKTK